MDPHNVAFIGSLLLTGILVHNPTPDRAVALVLMVWVMQRVANQAAEANALREQNRRLCHKQVIHGGPVSASAQKEDRNG